MSKPPSGLNPGLQSNRVPYSLPRSGRLRKRSEFLSVSQRGKKCAGALFVLIYCEGAAEVSRLGITVTKKVGHAVTRNRIKRACREYFRHHRHLLGRPFDMVIIARGPAARAASSEIFDGLDVLFKKILL